MDQHEHSVVMSTSRPEGAHVRLAGELDERAVDRLRALLDDLPHGAAVRVDLSRSARLPLGVLRALAAAHRRLGAGGGTLVLAQPSASAERALRVSGLDRVLVVQGWPEDAPKSVGRAV